MQEAIRSAVSTVVAISVSALLVACGGGGGGGGSSSSSGGTTPPPVTSDPGNLLTSLPVASYATGSREAAMFAELNAVRGPEFGYLRQSEMLDTAAKAHALYLQKVDVIPQIGPDGVQYTENGVAMFEFGPGFGQVDQTTGLLGAHSERTGHVEFTGATPYDRAKAAGYSGWASEVVAAEYSVPRGLSATCMSKLLNSVYHRNVLLDPTAADVGIGLSNLPSMTEASCVLNTGGGSTTIRPPDGWIGVFPKDGASNVVRAMWSRELPDPAPDISIIGNPISVYVKGTLTVTKFTLTSASGQVQARLLTNVNNSGISNNQAFLLPLGPLARNTKYTVSFVGSVGATQVSKDWTFTTLATDGRCDDGSIGCN